MTPKSLKNRIRKPTFLKILANRPSDTTFSQLLRAWGSSLEAFGAHRCPKDAKMDPKDGPQTSEMRPKIDENLAWGPYSGQEWSPGSNLKSRGCPGEGSWAEIGFKNIGKSLFVRVVSRVTGRVALRLSSRRQSPETI